MTVTVPDECCAWGWRVVGGWNQVWLWIVTWMVDGSGGHSVRWLYFSALFIVYTHHLSVSVCLSRSLSVPPECPSFPLTPLAKL